LNTKKTKNIFLTTFYLHIFLFYGSIEAETIKSSSFFLKSEFAQESNIFEDSEKEVLDNNGQFWCGLNYTKTKSKNFLLIDWIGNFAVYQNNPGEKKVTNTFNLRNKHDFSPSLFFSIHINLFNKIWINNNGDYLNGEINGRLGYKKAKTISQIGLYYRNNYYKSFKLFNSEQKGIILELLHSLNPYTILNWKLDYTEARYLNRTIFHEGDSDETSNLPFQKDKILSSQFGVEYRKKMIAGANCRLLYTDSNSDYSSFYNLSLQLYATRKIFKTIIQVITQIQLKQYTNDPSEHLMYYNPDPEQNVQNQFFLGWERPVIGKLSLTGKLALMRNETRYIGIYYDKWFLSTGIQYRFE